MLNIKYRPGAHLLPLDGLRGIAIILVLFFHCCKIDFFPFKLLSAFGWLGVDLFFVLSGFLITGILLDKKGKKYFFRNFFGRRFLRIFPIYYLTLAAVFLLIYFGKITFGDTNYYLSNQIYFWTYTQNFLFAFGDWSQPTSLLNHFWSLAIEEQFYLFWPLLIAYTRRNSIVFVCLCFVLLSIVLRNIYPEVPFAYVFTLARLDTLAVGALAAFFIRYNRQLLNKITLPIALCTLSGLLFIVFTTKEPSLANPYFLRIGYTLFAFFFGCLLLISLDKGRLGQLLSALLSIRFFRFFGKYSYGIYVYHFIFYLLFYEKIAVYFDFMGNYFFFVFSGIVVIFSLLSYHLVEEKFLKLKRYF